MINSRQFKELIRDIIHEEIGTGNNYKIGTVANVNGKPTIRFAGEDQPSQKKYSFLDSYTPVEGDRVLLASVSGTYVVIGKIQQDKGLQLENEYIVESGTNVNGEYVRYASGIQICWHTVDSISASPSTSVYQGITFYREAVSWTYPQPFISRPSVVFDGGITSNNLAPVFKRIIGTYTDRASLQIMSVFDFSTVADLSYFAIGRWKY